MCRVRCRTLDGPPGRAGLQGVVGGLLVGREGAVGVGRGRDADQRLQRQAQRATGGEDWVLECAVSVGYRYIITTSAQDNQEHSNWRSRGEALWRIQIHVSKGRCAPGTIASLYLQSVWAGYIRAGYISYPWLHDRGRPRRAGGRAAAHLLPVLLPSSPAAHAYARYSSDDFFVSFF